MFSKMAGISYPIYSFSDSQVDYYYTPGYLLQIKKEVSQRFADELLNPSNNKNVFINQLFQSAQAASQKYQLLRDHSFEPRCLTIYLNQKCTLDCAYCFSNLSHTKSKSSVSIKALQAAIELVAENCAKSTQPLTIVFHGGGEPILSWKTIEKLQPLMSAQRKKYNIPLFRYIATNGVMSEERALWLSKSVDMVGISCDGPASIQSIQRPLRQQNKHNSSYYLERTARILNSEKVPLQVRVTLTKETFNKQAEICDYICKVIHPDTIHVEPVYSGGKASCDSLMNLKDIEYFVQSYIEAKSLARNYGIHWEMSEVRLKEVHTAYCNIFRQVLQLVPGDAVSACFKYINSQQIENTIFNIGSYDPWNEVFRLDQSKIKSLQSNFSPPDKCHDCFIEYQCTHNCPNNCCLSSAKTSDFLCQLNQQIAFIDLQPWMKTLNKAEQPVFGLEIQ